MIINRSKIFSDNFLVQDTRKIDFIILHHIAAKNIDTAIALLKKHEVSSHYIINQNGEVFQLVADKDIAYHAGFSFWKGYTDLNYNSIGIEFFNPNPYKKKFSNKQLLSGINLCKFLKKKHKIKEDIIGHNDIAYFKDSGFLGRKDDPSHLFDWDLFYKNGLSFCRKELKTELIYFLKNCSLNNAEQKILDIKIKLKNIGYKIDNLDNKIDQSLIETINTILSTKKL